MAQRQATAQTKSSKKPARQQTAVAKARSATTKASRTKAVSPAKPAGACRPFDISVAVPRPKGKLGTLLTLIEAEGGATLEELSVALCWQPHSTRAAITGLRKRGFEIALVTEDGRKAYRIAA